MENFGVCILWPFGLFYDNLVYSVIIMNISYVVFLVYFPSFGMLGQEKSGNPDALLLTLKFCVPFSTIKTEKSIQSI
jgi:hypothetical protein